MGRMVDAISEANGALFFNRNYAKAINLRGRARLKLGQYAEAIGDLQLALKIEPLNREFMENLRHAETEAAKKLSWTPSAPPADFLLANF